MIVALGAWALVYAVVCAVAVARAVQSARRPRAVAPPSEPVLLLRPCAGAESSLARALALPPEALPPGSRVRFGVALPDDAAAPFAEAAAAALRAHGMDAALCVTHAAAPNQKAAQLAAMMVNTPDDCPLVAVVDSDVDPTSLDWSALCGPFADATVAAVWSPTVETSRGTAGDRASAALLSVTLHAFPLLSGLDPAGLVGKVMVVRRDALIAAGGFAALARYLGEDMELARRLRARGGRVVATASVARALTAGRVWESVVARYARWMTVIRGQRPALLASYPLLFFAAPLLVLWLAAAALAATGPMRTIAAGLLGTVLVARAAVALAGRWRAGVGPWGLGLAADAVMGDALLARAFVRALRGRTVRWRGRALTVGRDGVLVEA